MHIEKIETVDETPKESVPTADDGAFVLEDGQVLIPEETDIKEVAAEVMLNA